MPISDSFTPGDLVLDGPLRTRIVTIKSGADVARGSVLGRITASDKYILSDDGASDGSEDPALIALHDIEASGADAQAEVMAMGTVDGAKLVLDGTHTAATVEAAFRVAGIPIYVKTLA